MARDCQTDCDVGWSEADTEVLSTLTANDMEAYEAIYQNSLDFGTKDCVIA